MPSRPPRALTTHVPAAPQEEEEEGEDMDAYPSSMLGDDADEED